MKLPGLSQSEVSNLITLEIEKHKEKINSLGCNTEIGCMAGKKHFQMHEDKLTSDIFNLKTGVTKLMGDSQRSEVQAAEMLVSFKDAVDQFREAIKEVNEKIKLTDARIWGVFTGILLLVIATIWANYNIAHSVSKINSVDISNQANTEKFFQLIIEQLEKGEKKNGKAD